MFKYFSKEIFTKYTKKWTYKYYFVLKFVQQLQNEYVSSNNDNFLN